MNVTAIIIAAVVIAATGIIVGIVLVTAGLMAIAFFGFSGLL